MCGSGQLHSQEDQKILTRHEFLRSVGALALSAAVGDSALAQDYPSENIHLICGVRPGAGADVVVRHFAEKLRALAGRTTIVENHVGANSYIATRYVARSKPNGYTLFPYATTTVALTYHLYKNAPVEVGNALQVAATTNNGAFMLLVDARSPYKTVAELTAAMKKKGSSASYAIAANTGRIMGALYKLAARLDAVQVQYRAARDSLSEILPCELAYALHDPVFALAEQRAGRLRILAVSTSDRLGSFTDVPPMKQTCMPMAFHL